MTELIYAIGDAMTESFKLLIPIGAIVNGLFIAFGFVATAYWVNFMGKHPDKYQGNEII